MRLIPFVLMLACTVGLVDETKPVEPVDTAVADTEDTSEDTDTQDSDTDTLPDSENPYNGECSDNLDNDGDVPDKNAILSIEKEDAQEIALHPMVPPSGFSTQPPQRDPDSQAPTNAVRNFVLGVEELEEVVRG